MSKSKKNKVIQIYPREEFERAYKGFEEDPTLENYLDLLLEVQNSAELIKAKEVDFMETD